jgi:Caspase domain
MTETLVSRFGFDRNDIMVLTDEPESDQKPTGANIKRVLRDMIAKADSGDVLFLHYSGRLSQPLSHTMATGKTRLLFLVILTLSQVKYVRN